MNKKGKEKKMNDYNDYEEKRRKKREKRADILNNIRMFAAIAMLMTVVALIIISGVDLGYFNWIFAIGFIILIIVGLLTR